MNGLDFAIIAVVAWFTFTSFTSGLIRELLNVAGLLAGVFLAGRFYPLLSALPFWGEAFQATGGGLAAFATIFSATGLVSHLASTVLHRTLNLFFFLDWVNRLGGALFGFAKGVLVAGVALIALTHFSHPTFEGLLESSRIAPWFFSSLPLVFNLLPAEFDSVWELLPWRQGLAAPP